MNWKQFLTEKVLGECWKADGWFCQSCNEVKPPQKVTFHEYCDDCGDKLGVSVNRTFTTRNDLMDLYQQVYEDGKWDDFFWDFAFKRKPENYGLGEAETSVWLFCLNGEDYAERCKMVAEFYGWKADHD